jgi:ABC-type antimicrobial peptide transport system permease subunit
MMRISTLVRRNLAFYWRTNLAVVLGVATAVAVLAGALLVGDSVRASLRDLFLLRVGKTDHVISSTTFFREKLADDLQSHDRFTEAFGSACPLIVLEGFVTHEKSRRRASRVQVYGVDDRFWKFHGRQGEASPPGEREALISADLARELGNEAGDSILLRIEKPSAIPAGSLHGRKEEQGRTIRLSARGSLGPAALGEFSIRPQQGPVRAVFVSLARLQTDLEQVGKVNTILLAERQSGTGKGQPNEETKIGLMRDILKDRFALEDLGIKLRALDGQRGISLDSESAVINGSLQASALRAAAESKATALPVLSYLANSIRTDERDIPYSLVTAIDADSFAALKHSDTRNVSRAAEGMTADGNKLDSVASAGAEASQPELPPVLLNEWAANDLGAKIGDVVTLDYYLWGEEGRLLTETARFQLAGVVPIEGRAADRDLVPHYPGITETESLSDWDPPFPVDLQRVRPRDEDYWHKYRTTPKAFIPLEAGQHLWQTRYGKLTSLRILPADSSEAQSSLQTYKNNLRASLDPIEAGLSVYPARNEGVVSSRGATDFGEYFVYFSFFIVVSALLLASLFFKLGIEHRLREIGVLRSVGFSAAQVRSIFLREGLALSAAGSFLGMVGALGYAALLMIGLRTWWVGAVGTTMLSLHISPASLAVGGAGGILVAVGCVVWTLRALRRASPRSLLAGDLGAETQPAGAGRASASSRLLSASRAAMAFAAVGFVLLLCASLGRIGQTAGFFGAGGALLAALLCFEYAWLRGKIKKPIHGSGWWPVSRMGFRNAMYRPGRSILCIALIASAAFIIVAVDAFRRDASDSPLDKRSGSGGFPLLAESLLPLYHDPNTEEGREAMTLSSQKDFDPEDITFAPFRVRPGDDTSCLNLYQPQNPRILAPSDEFLKSGRFAFQDSLAGNDDEKENPWLLLSREIEGGAVPVIADANSITYVLHRKLGDEIIIDRNGGEPVRLRLVAALQDSIFQGELLISEKNFLRLFPDLGGYSFFLLNVAPADAAAAAGVLEEQLSDFGFDVSSTAERIASFHRVENTYLSTFQTLGGLGLILGTMGLATVLLRNVLERRRELALLRAVGYDSRHFALMVLTENAFLVCCGLATGTVSALLAIAPALFSRGGHVPTLSLILLLMMVLITGLAASILATRAALRSPLLPALRAE